MPGLRLDETGFRASIRGGVEHPSFVEAEDDLTVYGCPRCSYTGLGIRLDLLFDL